MTTIADYQTLWDGSFRIEVPGSPSVKDLSFSRPTDLVFGENRAKFIVQYLVTPTEDSALWIYFNNFVVARPSFPKGAQRAHWVFFAASEVFPGGMSNSTEPLRFQARRGTMHITNVVMWYQRRRD